MPIQNYPTVFDCTEMTAAVNKLPALPVYFRRLFEVKGVKTTTVSLDIRKGRIVLIGDSERNTAPESLAGRGAKREWMHLSCAHLAMSDTLAPEDLQDVRAFGSTEPISVAEVYNDKMQQLKDNMTATMEFHRLGAIKGVVLDANGTTVLHDIFNTFGVTKKKMDISFPKTAADDANPILTSILNAKRHVEAAMGGTPKHPHVRGEDKIEASREGLSLETPPRAWGRLWVHCCDIGGSRNTPTCVGKT